jgi:hypothetical protein
MGHPANWYLPIKFAVIRKLQDNAEAAQGLLMKKI